MIITISTIVCAVVWFLLRYDRLCTRYPNQEIRDSVKSFVRAFKEDRSRFIIEPTDDDYIYPWYSYTCTDTVTGKIYEFCLKEFEVDTKYDMVFPSGTVVTKPNWLNEREQNYIHEHLTLPWFIRFQRDYLGG